MKKLSARQINSMVLQTILSIGVLLLLVWRVRVGLTRFFDVDEFTHLHWASAMARGVRPYIDFFTFFTPGFYWFLAPFFWIFGSSVSLFLAVRAAALGVFLMLLASLGLLFGLMRSWRYALVPVILLAFLPMPYDKFLELRPDNLATLLGLVGVLFQSWALINGTHKRAVMAWGAAGLAYGWSVIVLVKMLPFVAVGAVIAVIDSGIIEAIVHSFTKKTKFQFSLPKEYVWFVLGLCIPVGIFVVWALSLGNLSTVLYSLTKMPFESNAIGNIYIMEPHLFFFPNISFYGGWGITWGLILNHALWTIGVFAGVLRFFTPYIASNGNRKKVLAELLIATIFVLSTIGYVNFFPLKHSQYLIPIAIFIAFYAADCFVAGFQYLDRRGGSILVLTLISISVYVLWQQAIVVNQGKLALSNTKQMQEVTALQSLIPPGDEVFDLEGRMIYWRDPYYICCLPMGSFVHLLSRRPPPVQDVLESRKVPYIFQGTSGRLWELSSDLSYIQSVYERVPDWGDALWRRKSP